MLKIDRITFDPNIMTGKACIRGMRISVTTVLKLLASGMSKEEILSDYPYLESEDIDQCLNYAALLAEKDGTSLSEKYAGILPASAAKKLQKHIKKSREEWDI